MPISNTELCLSVKYLFQSTINETQPLAMTYATKSDSSVQALHQECYDTEGQNYLSKFGLGSQMGVIYSQ